MTTFALASAPPEPRWPWVRDFALVGLLTGFFAPFAVIHEVTYSALAGVGGLLSGAALGAASAWLLDGRARRWPGAALVPLGLFVGALWGACAALPTALFTMEMLFWSVLFASIAGALQLGWLWPVYWHRRVGGRSTVGAVAVASVLGAGLGWAGVFAVF